MTFKLAILTRALVVAREANDSRPSRRAGRKPGGVPPDRRLCKVGVFRGHPSEDF